MAFETYRFSGLKIIYSLVNNICDVVVYFQSFEHGVPQGSTFGPSSFSLYISNLPNASFLLHFVLFTEYS